MHRFREEKTIYYRNCVTAILFVLLTCLSLGGGYFEHAVLCITSDRHVAIESALNGKCVNFSDISFGFIPRSSVINIQAITDSHCGKCVDIPLSLHRYIKNSITKNIILQKELYFPVIFSSSSSVINTNFTETHLIIHPPVADMALNSLSSVIKLI